MITYKELVEEAIKNLKEIQSRDSKRESALNSLPFFDPNKELILENYTEEELDEIYTAMDQDHQEDQLFVSIDNLIPELESSIEG